MRVLFGIDTFGLVGGTERYASVVIPALVERGHQVSVLCRSAPDASFLADAVEEVAPEADLGTGKLSHARSAALAATVRRLAPDVVYLQSLHDADTLAVLGAHAPLVLYVHDHTLFCPGLNKNLDDGELCAAPMGLACLESYYLRGGCDCFKRAMHTRRVVEPLHALGHRMREVEVAQHATARLLTNSRYMRDELLRVGFTPDRTSVLYQFTRSNTAAQPAGSLPAATEQFLAASSAPLLFTPARLVLPDKGLDLLLTALARLAVPFRAVIAGSGPGEELLREQARAAGLLDRVHFTGWLDSPAMETLYSRADVVVCPSVWNEPFGLVGIEAYAHGRPVVAFAVGGIPEWLEDEATGLLVARKDTRALAHAMERLITDLELARRMGERGREKHQREFGQALHMQSLEAILARAAALG